MIRIENLTKRFGKFVAVDSLSLHVKPGEVFALLGPNGSGKTTTLKTIVGLNLPTAGRVIVAGLDAVKDAQAARAIISYLPQRANFPERLYAREILTFYAKLRNLAPQAWKQSGAQAAIDGFSEKTVGELSGGMAQRLGLAVLAMPDAPLLILDEPTANLDPQGVKQFRDFVLEQKSRGKTILFSTHLLAEAETLADRVGIFVGGRLRAVESVATLHDTVLQYQTLEDVYLHYVESQNSCP